MEEPKLEINMDAPDETDIGLDWDGDGKTDFKVVIKGKYFKIAVSAIVMTALIVTKIYNLW